jgi:carboxyl-terminal processing protease
MWSLASRRWLPVWGLALVAVIACRGPAGPTTAVTSGTSTTAAPTITPTASGPPPLNVTDCRTPPVTFGLLCQVVGLVSGEHLSPPSDDLMAAGAAAAIATTDLPAAAAPRGTITCAVPGPAYRQVCDAVGERLAIDPADIGEMIEAAVGGVLEAVGDPYTQYLPPGLVGAIGEDGIIPGTGLVITARTVAGSPCVRVQPACPLTVEAVVASGPADQAGLRRGDTIEAVDGSTVEGQTVLEIAARLAGEEGSRVAVTARRDGRTLSLDMYRQAAEGGEVTAALAGSTGYLRVPVFALDTHLAVHQALTELIAAGARSLILDLRDNPGGVLFSVSIIGSEFVGDGLLYRTRSADEQLDFPAVPGGVALRLPLTVLVNRSSASAAEVLAAALAERGRAVVVGRPTFGKNLVQRPFELRNGGVLRVSTQEWTTPRGATVAGEGWRPDVIADLPDGTDITSLVAAVERLTG